MIKTKEDIIRHFNSLGAKLIDGHYVATLTAKITISEEALNSNSPKEIAKNLNLQIQQVLRPHIIGLIDKALMTYEEK